MVSSDSTGTRSNETNAKKVARTLHTPRECDLDCPICKDQLHNKQAVRPDRDIFYKSKSSSSTHLKRLARRRRHVKRTIAPFLHHAPNTVRLPPLEVITNILRRGNSSLERRGTTSVGTFPNCSIGRSRAIATKNMTSVVWPSAR